MNNIYNTVISRDEFISLYKFGEIYINKNFLLGENKEDEILDLLKLLPFADEEDYLILEIDGKLQNRNLKSIDVLYKIELIQVKKIYVLSEKAQRFYQTKFNPKIKFHIIYFANFLKKILDFKEIQDMDRGINILIKQFDLECKGIEKFIEKDLKENFLKSTGNLSEEFKNFYLDLLVYKRENKFINNSISYIYDIIILFLLKDRNQRAKRLNLLKQGSFPLDQSSTYQKFQELELDKKKTLYECIEFIINANDESIKKFTGKISNQELIVGAVFLNIKYFLLQKTEGYIDEIANIINEFKNEYRDEVGCAIYLIGLLFGYKELYDDYYNFLDLDIFKDSETISAENEIEKSQDDILLGIEKKKNRSLENKNRELEKQLNTKENEDTREVKNLKEVIQDLKKKEDLETKIKNTNYYPIEKDEIIKFDIKDLRKIATIKKLKVKIHGNDPIKLYEAITEPKPVQTDNLF